MTEPYVHLTHEGPVAIVTLDRPKALNALSAELAEQIADAVRTAETSARAVVLTGSDRAFCAGADITQVGSLRDTPAHERLMVEDLFATVSSCAVPVIAAVRGMAFGGGCELVLACDTVVAGESATFALPEVSLGLIPGAGGTQRLVHAIGKAKAMRMLLTGEPVDARWALDAGIVAEVVPDAEVVTQATRLAEKIATNGPMAVALAAEAARRAHDLPLTQALHLEKRNFQLALRSADAAEGTRAFVEKRTPAFEGR